MGRKVVIRCKKCWVDVNVQLETDALPPCPKCKEKGTTYAHAYFIRPKPKNKDREAKDGSAGPG